MTSPADREEHVRSSRAVVIGVGLIGGSVGMGLRAAGWHVTGLDEDPEALSLALERGAIDQVGPDPLARLVVVAVPSGRVVEVLSAALIEYPDSSVIFTDVAGVKSAICQAIGDPRFIGGHPMAGSEQSGIAGSRSDLFLGASWVLTPNESTPPERYGDLLAVISSLGAQGIALSPVDHDRLVALVSHVPHLVAVSLMNEAAAAAQSDAALLQLAAGGFRDMTRIAAGDPSIWPDVCLENRSAILEALDDVVDRIGLVRSAVALGDRDDLVSMLASASHARNALPARSTRGERLSQVRIPVTDRPGVLAEVTSAASELGVSVFDVEIAHSIEGDQGVLIVVVDTGDVDRFAERLSARGFSCSTNELA